MNPMLDKETMSRQPDNDGSFPNTRTFGPYEWESLEWPVRGTVTNPAGLEHDYTQVELFRTDEFDIHMRAAGKTRKDFSLSPRHGQQGSFIDGVNQVEIELRSGRRLTLENVFPAGGVFKSSDVDLFRKLERDANVFETFYVGRARIRPTEARSTKKRLCALWCLNGPKHRFYPAGTKRRLRVTHERHRFWLGNQVYSTDPTWLTRDTLPIASPAFVATNRAVISTVPGEVVAASWRAQCIQFPMKIGETLPDWETIYNYVTEVSFALARPLLLVGYSIFDEALQPVEAGFTSCQGRDTSRYVDESDYPLTDLGDIISPQPVIKLMKSFRKSNSTLGLSSIMNTIWDSDLAPLSLQVPALMSALESLANAWVRSQKPKKKIRLSWVRDKAWKNFIGPVVASLQSEFKDTVAGKAIGLTLERANQFGLAERMRRFLRALGLEVGDVEVDAIQLRHTLAHGGSVGSQDFRGAVLRAEALRSLLNRCILKLIGWRGTYVDYSTIGWPDRELKEALGGPHGEREPFDDAKGHAKAKAEKVSRGTTEN